MVRLFQCFGLVLLVAGGICFAQGESVSIFATSSFDHSLASFVFQKSEANRATAHSEPARTTCRRGFLCISLWQTVGAGHQLR